MYLLPLIFSLLSMFSVATFWAPVATAGPSPTKQNDPSIIEGADAYLKAVVAGDAKAVAAMFDDDAIVMPPNQQLLRGKLAIQHFYGKRQSKHRIDERGFCLTIDAEQPRPWG